MRASAWIVLLVVVVCGFSTGCPKSDTKKGTASVRGGSFGGPATETRITEVETRRSETAPSGGWTTDFKKTDSGEYAPKEVAPKEIAAATSKSGPEMSSAKNRGPGAGQLTAGSFDDTLHWQAFHGFLRKLGQNGDLSHLPSQFQGRRLTVTVKDAAGLPVDNAR